jgi:hypothetical protein
VKTGALALMNPSEFARGWRRTFRSSGDFILALRIGWFVWSLPRHMARAPLPDLLARLGSTSSAEPAAIGLGVERVARLRQAWLNRSLLAGRNTCYVRALTLFHFLHADRGELRFHLGVEPVVDHDDRLRGHAWVSYRGELLEPPEPVSAGRVEELYVFPEP